MNTPSDPGPSGGTPRLTRFGIDKNRKTITEDVIWEGAGEFPSINPRFSASRHRYIWLQKFPEENGTGGGVMRMDALSHEQRVYHAPIGHLGTEPIFVPDGRQEGTGWLLQMFQDTTRGQSYLAVFNSEALEEGSVARLWFKQKIPMTFHGTFVADATVSSPPVN